MSVSRVCYCENIPCTCENTPLVVDDQGLEVEVEKTAPHEVLLTAEWFVAIKPDDWDQMVAFVEAERARLSREVSP